MGDLSSVAPLGAFDHACIKIEIWMGPNVDYIRGAYDKFPDFFRMGTFIDSTHMKL